MKKLIFFLGVLVFFISSCRKEYIPVPTHNNQTILIGVQSGDWRTSDYGVNYAVSLNVPEITYDFNQRGEVLVYINYGNGIYEQVPEIYNDISYSFTHNTGRITIYAQDLAGVGIVPPENATIKIVLIPSSY